MSDDIFENAYAQCRINAEMIELARRHCQRMEFTEAMGRGMLEVVPGSLSTLVALIARKSNGTMIACCQFGSPAENRGQPEFADVGYSQTRSRQIVLSDDAMLLVRFRPLEKNCRVTESRERWMWIAAVLVGMHVVGVLLLASVLLANGGIEDFAVLAGLGVTAYLLGARHAFDADHILAIDNSTRALHEIAAVRRRSGSGSHSATPASSSSRASC